MRTRLLLAFALLVAVVALGGCTTKVVTTNGAPPLYSVTAQGIGKVATAPDMAEMSFGVGVLEKDAKTALGNAAAAGGAIADAVKKAGIPAEDIQTANVSVYPEYSGGETKDLTITGYRASVQVRVKIRDVEKMGDVIKAASDAGANEVSGPSFTLSDDSDVRNEAIEAAIADARKRAEVMAKAAGKSLGEIISVSETGVTIPPIYYDMGARAEALDSVPIEPGQLDVSSSVTVVFELK